MLLKGIRVIEFAGLAPVPFCGKILSDYGADVVRIDKPNMMNAEWLHDNKRSILLNLKKPSAIEVVKKMCLSYDVLIDPYRPGVLEKMGLGPKETMTQNPKLIYARLSGFGQTGPMSSVGGHDINYLALSGILSMLGKSKEPPTPPINLLADFAGGGLLCAFGIVLALLDRTTSGVGQVVDLSMAEGSAYVGSWLYSSQNSVLWGRPRGQNWLDGGTHFYSTYETKDNKYMAVGAIEPQFYSNLLKGLELNPEVVEHMDNFEENKKILAEKFKEKTQEDWITVFSSLDACVTPVLSLKEAPLHPHNKARANFHRVKGQFEPTACPKLCDVQGTLNKVIQERQVDDPNCPSPGEHTDSVLTELGYTQDQIKKIMEDCGMDAGHIGSKL